MESTGTFCNSNNSFYFHTNKSLFYFSFTSLTLVVGKVCVLVHFYCRKQVYFCEIFVGELPQVNITVEPHSRTLNEGMIMQ